MSHAADHNSAPTKTKSAAIRLEAKDNLAFEERWPTVERAVLRALFNGTNDPELTQDLCQLTALKAVQSLHLRPESIRSFESYCIQIARNVVIDHFRTRERDFLRSCCQIEGHNEPVVRSSDEDLNEQLRDMLREFKPQLSDRERAVVDGALDGKTEAEIGADMKRTPRRVKQILKSIGKRAREFFGCDWLRNRIGRRASSGVKQ